MRSTAYLFPFAEYWWFYLGFTVLVLFLLALDLGVFHKKAHAVSFKEASIWCLVWVGLALVFNVALYYYSLHAFSVDPRFAGVPGFDVAGEAWRVALEFATGFVIEKSLSIDNIFVFVVVFGFFSVPAKYQHRVLFFGILGALIFRSIFIAAGAFLMTYKFVVWFFGAFLILTGFKLMLLPEKEPEPEKNLAIRLLKRCFPVTTSFEGQRFFVRIDGKLHITPLLVCLVFLELTDIVFAFDSVPAIFAITNEPLIVFTSNIFAILGLRALYFILAGALDMFYLLKYGISLVLVFVGLKMVWLSEHFGGKFPIGVSLTVILALIGLSIIASLAFPKKP